MTSPILPVSAACVASREELARQFQAFVSAPGKREMAALVLAALGYAQAHADLLAVVPPIAPQHLPREGA